MMNLVAALVTTGASLQSWRHPRAFANSVMNYDQMLECARIAEGARMDAVFLFDQNAVIEMENRALFESATPWSRPVAFEPLTLLAALARETSDIGLVSTANTTYDQPFLVARRFASLDYLSGGRAGWNIVTGAFDIEARNFNVDEPPSKAERYARAREFYEVADGLWDSWADDAFPEDRETGVYLNADRVRTLDHEGTFFKVRGPLNVARPVQGKPVIFHAGQSEAGRDLAAYAADCVFGLATDKASAIVFRADIRERAARFGRDPNSIRILPGLSPFVGETHEEVRSMERELGALISPALGVHFLSGIVSMDLSGHAIDGPMPELPPADIVGVESIRKNIGEMAAREKLTLRQTYERLVPSLGHMVARGTPAEVADLMEDWYRSGACDGFIVSGPIMPYGLTQFADLVVPELRRRGLFRSEYEGSTLRENLGLPVPASSWLAPRAADPRHRHPLPPLEGERGIEAPVLR